MLNGINLTVFLTLFFPLHIYTREILRIPPPGNKKWTLFECTNWEHYFYLSYWRCDLHFTWSSDPSDGLAFCRAKRLHQIVQRDQVSPLLVVTGLSLRFQVAGYLLLVAGEVASSRGAPSSPKKFLKCNFYRFPKGITAQKKQSSSRAELSLAVLWWSRLY